MNPIDRFEIDNFKEILKEIESLGRLDLFQDLEVRVIQEIIKLVNDGTESAKIELQKLEKIVNEELNYTPRNRLLISALKNSILGALSAAKFSLL